MRLEIKDFILGRWLGTPETVVTLRDIIFGRGMEVVVVILVLGRTSIDFRVSGVNALDNPPQTELLVPAPVGVSVVAAAVLSALNPCHITKLRRKETTHNISAKRRTVQNNYVRPKHGVHSFVFLSIEVIYQLTRIISKICVSERKSDMDDS